MFETCAASVVQNMVCKESPTLQEPSPTGPTFGRVSGRCQQTIAAHPFHPTNRNIKKKHMQENNHYDYDYPGSPRPFFKRSLGDPKRNFLGGAEHSLWTSRDYKALACGRHHASPRKAISHPWSLLNQTSVARRRSRPVLSS